MLHGINLTNGYLQINFNKEKGIAEIKIFNNEDDLVFTGSITGYDFTKALLSDKAPIEGTISFDDSISRKEEYNKDIMNFIKMNSIYGLSADEDSLKKVTEEYIKYKKDIYENTVKDILTKTEYFKPNNIHENIHCDDNTNEDAPEWKSHTMTILPRGEDLRTVSQFAKVGNINVKYKNDDIKFTRIPNSDIGDLSDGYHTFNDLYYQRAVLFATIVNQNSDIAWKSFKHEDGKYCFDKNGEWFIVGIDTPEGSYTYHYEKKYWDMFKCKELECAKHWDGHTDKDVTRLLSLTKACRYNDNMKYDGITKVYYQKNGCTLHMFPVGDDNIPDMKSITKADIIMVHSGKRYCDGVKSYHARLYYDSLK